MKTIYSIISIVCYLALGCLTLTAYTEDFVAPSDLKPDSGVVFKTTKDGFTLLVSLPSTAKDLNSVELKMTLINNTGTDFHFEQESNLFLAGYQFDLTDASGQKVEHTSTYKKAIVPGNYYSGHWRNIKNGYAWVTTHSLSKHSNLTTPGQYKLDVDWRLFKNGSIGMVAQDPKIALSGTILISRLPDGSFTIVPVNN
jgi:hypothetical protein